MSGKAIADKIKIIFRLPPSKTIVKAEIINANCEARVTVKSKAKLIPHRQTNKIKSSLRVFASLRLFVKNPIKIPKTSEIINCKTSA